ncbi:MAG: hypothetical protein ACOCZE_00645 [Planctomycetota bacterium]
MKPTITSWILAAAAGLGLVRLAGAQTEPARLAAESLRHDAQSLLLEPDATARAGRTFALVQAAEAPKDENPAGKGGRGPGQLPQVRRRRRRDGTPVAVAAAGGASDGR